MNIRSAIVGFVLGVMIAVAVPVLAAPQLEYSLRDIARAVNRIANKTVTCKCLCGER